VERWEDRIVGRMEYAGERRFELDESGEYSALGEQRVTDEDRRSM
jgi:hypothetical protein